MRRQGRGRLSSIDLLPDWAEPAVTAALAKLRDAKQPQIEIHEEFNAELRTLAFAAGVVDPPQISASAFNRKTMKLAQLGRRLAERREIATALAAEWKDTETDDLALVAAQTINAIIQDAVDDAWGHKASGVAAEMMANYSIALKNAVQVKRITADTRLVIEKGFAKKAEAAIDAVAKERGLSADVAQSIRAKILNLKAEPTKAEA